MPYKSKETHRIKALENYYKNREKRVLYQREYDKKNKEKKNEYERSKRRTNLDNLKYNIRHYSQKYHLPKLLEKYKGCQFCQSVEDLQIHHKIYDKKIESCLLLCSSCHKKIHRKI